jgi:hypothetical protein
MNKSDGVERAAWNPSDSRAQAWARGGPRCATLATVINSCAVLWKPAGERPTVRGIFEIVGLGQAVRVGVGLIGSGFVIVGTYL